MRVGHPIEKVRRALDVLLSFEPGRIELKQYLGSIARLVSDLLEVDWTLVTLAKGDTVHVVASTRKPYLEALSIHGLVGEKIHRTGLPVIVNDAAKGAPGKMPSGFRAFF